MATHRPGTRNGRLLESMRQNAGFAVEDHQPSNGEMFTHYLAREL